MNLMKRCLAAAVIAAAVGTQLFCPDFICYDNIMISAAAESRISDRGIELIKDFEGFVRFAHWDYMQWSIGYGTRVEEGEYPDGITEEEAEVLLRKAVARAEEYVQSFLSEYRIDVTQNQYDALVSFTYNLGNVWADPSEVTLGRYLVNGIENYSKRQIKDAFGLWVKAGGEVSPGLVRRRAAEADLFLSDGNYMPDEVFYEMWRITAASGVRFRTLPDTSSDALGLIPYSSVVTVTEKKRNEGFLWGKVTMSGKEGWCVLDYAEHLSGNIQTPGAPSEIQKSERWVITAEKGVNLRTGAGVSYSTAGFIPYSSVITVYEKKESEGYTWGKTEYNGAAGWCVLDFASRFETEVMHVKGDINGDGKVDFTDVFHLNSYLLKAEYQGDPGTSGDLNGDGTVDVIDSIIARKQILNS